MVNYLVFTNIYKKPSTIRYYRNQNKFKTFYAETIEEVKEIIKEVEKNGHKVTQVKTAMGKIITL